jgi:small-conductance mechanosensitive channel
MGLTEVGAAIGDRFSLILTWMREPIFTVGDASFTALGIFKLLLYLFIMIWIARIIRRILVERIFPRTHVELGTAHAVGNLLFYALVTLGLMVGLQTSGIDLSTLTVLFGAIGVGIGFGLQTIASNFVSGLIILFEQPIRVGDRIQVGDLDGRVIRIRARATEIRTNDDISVFVPNLDFISKQVVNWSHGGDKIRIPVPVGVSYGSDVEKVRAALLEAAAGVEAALQDPAPVVRFKGFGDSSLDFEVLGWTSELFHAPREFVSRMNFSIHASLKRHGIEIPFPQRDLHLRSAIPLPLLHEEQPDRPGDPPERGHA